MYDSRDHKICQCMRNFTIIDSSSDHGAIIKPPGDVWQHKERVFVWEHDGNGNKRNLRAVSATN